MTIIAATDFTKLSENAVDYAASIAKIANADLLIYNSFQLPVHAANSHLSADNFQKLLDENNHRLKNRCIEISKSYQIKVEYKSSLSFIEDELKLLTGFENVVLIVLGMNEKTLEQDLMGNTTTSAIKSLHIPILAVPINAKFEGVRKLLFACDTAEEVPDKVLSRIRETADNLKGEMEIFSVSATVKELKSENSDFLAKNAIDKKLEGINYYYKNVRSNAVIIEIEKEINDFGADLLIMVPKKYGFWESIVHRSKTRIMASGLDIPLLSIPID